MARVFTGSLWKLASGASVWKEHVAVFAGRVGFALPELPPELLRPDAAAGFQVLARAGRCLLCHSCPGLPAAPGLCASFFGKAEPSARVPVGEILRSFLTRVWLFWKAPRPL